MNKVWKSQQAIIGVVLLSSLFLGGCSVNDSKDLGAESDSSSSTVASADVNKDFEQAVLDTVDASGVPAGQWYYSGGEQFEVQEFKAFVPDADTYCGDSEDDQMLYRKSVFLEYEHSYSSEEYKKISEKVFSAWESQGRNPGEAISDSKTHNISFRTDSGILVQFSAGETGLIVQADSRCNLSSPEPSPSA